VIRRHLNLKKIITNYNDLEIAESVTERNRGWIPNENIVDKKIIPKSKHSINLRPAFS